MKSVLDLINEIKNRSDLDYIDDAEILEYINDLEGHLSESVFPTYSSVVLPVVDGEMEFNVSSKSPDAGDIVAVYVDGKRLLKRRDEFDLIEGWFVKDGTLCISDSFSGAERIVMVMKSPQKRHAYSKISSDRDLIVPSAYHDLYVFYALSQIAAKEADEVSYKNYKQDYNSLLSEVISVVTRSQLFPRYTL